MNMHKDWKRRVRIEGGMKDIAGFFLTATDVETGERINNIEHVFLLLSPSEKNRAVIKYCRTDESGKFMIGEDRNLIKETIQLDNIEIAVTALEVDELPEG